MKNKVLIELTKAESLLNNWKWLPGSQVKVLINHLIKSIDLMTSHLLNKETVLERDYLSMSAFKLFSDESVESSFYDTYYHLKSLSRKDIQRVDSESINIVGDKGTINAERDYFEFFINNVRTVFDEVFNP
ncbi:MAG: hypothetical protein WC307_04685 [Candidatus Nanoarchaeia archaeon]|jgi:hypothetical protein